MPTPEEVDAFVNDPSPDAYEKLVDRLLASPRYGERQARLWLDLARYADSDRLPERQHAAESVPLSRLRDQGLQRGQALFTHFIQEQIAGDEIAPGDQDVLVATGFLAGYPDNSNSRDLVQRKYQITTDMVDTVGQAILGTTVGCARCHNHKTDKFTQKDYYLAAGFLRQHGLRGEGARQKGRAGNRLSRRRRRSTTKLTKDIRAKQKAIIELGR